MHKYVNPSWRLFRDGPERGGGGLCECIGGSMDRADGAATSITVTATEPISPDQAESSPTGVPSGNRMLDLMVPAGDADRWRLNLRWVRKFVLLHFAIRSFLTLPAPFAGAFAWLFGGDAASPVPLGYEALLWASAIVGIAGMRARLAMPACRVAALALLAQMLVPMTPTGLPLTANHIGVEFLFLCALSFLDERKQGEDALLLSAARWMAAILFFYTGVQKLLYGTYFDGQFLAFQMATDDRFATMFQFVVPAEEFERLRALRLEIATDGAGPFRVDSLPFVVMSNLVYVFEITIPILLLFARTRMLAALAGIAFVVVIELGALEITFGIFMINLFLLFLPGAWNKRLFPLSVALYVPLLLKHAGLIESGLLEFAPA